jgi:predicted nucleic acid-binding Zn finger protein
MKEVSKGKYLVETTFCSCAAFAVVVGHASPCIYFKS